MSRAVDVAVIGGGIAGASAAAELAAGASVLLLETEERCGHHSTGRSAASYTENYGSPLIRRLAMASRAFLESPPEGFATGPLLRPRGMLTIGRADQADRVAAEMAEGQRLVPSIRPVSPDEALALVPALRPGYLAAAFYEPDQRDLDVDALHQGFLRLARARGTEIRTRAPVTALARKGSRWEITTPQGPVSAAAVVNAAGAWADAVAELAGMAPLGLTPMRRTAFLIPAPEGSAAWPMVNDVDETFYFKPDAGRLLVSPGDATPSPPMDAWPHDIDVAHGADRLEKTTTLSVTRVLHAWAGLRSFFPDRNPVVGEDPRAQGFFWLAGQGGYGIKTSPALARAVAGLVLAGRLPDDLPGAGIAAEALAPNRLLAGAAPARNERTTV